MRAIIELEQLWHLQEADIKISELTGEIENNPLRQSVEQGREELAECREELAGEEEALKEQRRRLKLLELDLQKNTAEREGLRKKLYGGEVSNVRELGQMEKKLESLEKEQLTREEQTLELMESIEEGEQRQQSVSGRAGEAEEKLKANEEQLRQELKRLEEELARMREHRDRLASRLEGQLLDRYRHLSQKHLGRCLARVVNDRCTGCSVFISSAQRGFLYNPQTMVYCESCGRLLVRLAEKEAAD